MKFYNIALAATVSAASTTVTAPESANIGGAVEPKFFTAPLPAAVGDTFTWAKGYGNGLARDSKIIAVDSKADVDLTFNAVYKADLGNDAAQALACPTTPIDLAVPIGTDVTATGATSAG